MEYFYRAYGLNIAANRPIPGLPAYAEIAEADFAIEFDPAVEIVELIRPEGWHVRHRLGESFAYALRATSAGAWHHLYFFDNGHSIEFLIEPQLRQAYVFWSAQAPYQDVIALTRNN